MAYTSTYVPALGEIVDITKDTTSVMGRVKQKIVKESPPTPPHRGVFFWLLRAHTPTGGDTHRGRIYPGKQVVCPHPVAPSAN